LVVQSYQGHGSDGQDAPKQELPNEPPADQPGPDRIREGAARVSGIEHGREHEDHGHQGDHEPRGGQVGHAAQVATEQEYVHVRTDETDQEETSELVVHRGQPFGIVAVILQRVAFPHRENEPCGQPPQGDAQYAPDAAFHEGEGSGHGEPRSYPACDQNRSSDSPSSTSAVCA